MTSTPKYHLPLFEPDDIFDYAESYNVFSNRAEDALSDFENVNNNSAIVAQTALETAEEAKTLATTADGKADLAISTANTASSTAGDAVTTANAASVKADEAKAQSQLAYNAAVDAQTTANGVDAKATEALSNSQTALTTAGNADTKAQNAIDTVAQLNDTVGIHTVQIGDLRTDLTTTNNDLASLSGRVDTLENSISAFGLRIDNVESSVAGVDLSSGLGVLGSNNRINAVAMYYKLSNQLHVYGRWYITSGSVPRGNTVFQHNYWNGTSGRTFATPALSVNGIGDLSNDPMNGLSARKSGSSIAFILEGPPTGDTGGAFDIWIDTTGLTYRT